MLFPEVIEMHRNRGLLLLFGILVALSVFVAALDAKNVAAEISRLWGTDITGGELLSAVAPELLAYFPPGVWDAPVFWQGSDFNFTWIGNQGVSEDRNEEKPEGMFDIYLDWTSKLYVFGKDVQFGSSTTVIWPPFLRLPIMIVWSQLLEDGFSIDACGTTSYDVWRTTVNKTRHVQGGAYYQAMGYHYSEAPAGYYPPAVLLISYSVSRWIDE
jgi:hypothetical protein